MSKRIVKKQSTDVAAFARRLKELRAARGLSQMTLARKTGVNLSYLNKLERAEATPGLDLICRLASGLGIPPNEMLVAPWPIEPIKELRQLAREHYEAALTKSDRATLEMLAQLHSLINSAEMAGLK